MLRTVVCPVWVSVALVYCGQTVGRIKMPLGTEIDVSPGHIVLDGSQLPHGRGTASPTFRPIASDILRKLYINSL